MRSTVRSPYRLWISAEQAIAPALIIGLSGRPVSGYRLIELNASLDGSTPTLASVSSSPHASSARPYTNGLEIDWIVNGTSTSPTQYAWPSAVASTIPNHAGSALDSSGM